MKYSTKILSLLSLTITLLSITACQKEELQPSTLQGATARVATTDLVATMPSFYRLIKQNLKTLTYDSKGRLIKTVDDEGAWDITYSYQFIRRKRVDNLQVTDYFLDANGRCIKSVTTYPGIAAKPPYILIYVYTPQGRLSKLYNQVSPSATVDYAYNRVGDLTSITYHKWDGSILDRFTYAYQFNLYDLLLDNTYALNPDAYATLDPDLAIYGKFYNHFFRREVKVSSYNSSVLDLQYDKSFYYTLNSDGVPTQQKVKVSYPGYAAYTYTNNYTYQVTPLTLTP